MPAATEAAPAAPMDNNKPLYPSGLRPPSRQGHYASPATAATTTVTASNSQQEIPTLTAAAPETLNSTKVNSKKETKRRRSSKARNKSRSVPTSEERVGPPPPPPPQEKKKARSVSRRRRSSKSLKPEELLKKSDTTTKSSKPTEDTTITNTKMSLSGTSESSSSFLPKTLVSPARGRSSKNTKDRSKATASPSPLRLMVPGGFMTPTKTRSSSSSGRLSPKSAAGRLSPCNANTKPSTNKGITSKTSKKSMTGKTMIAKKEKGQRALMSQSARTASGSNSTRRPLETKPKRKRKSGGGLSQSAREPARTSSTSSLSSSASDLDQSSDFLDRSISLLDELRLDKSTRGTRSSNTLEQRSSLAMPAAYCIEDPLMSKSTKNPLFDELRADKSTRTRSLEIPSPLRMDRLSQSEGNLRYQNYDDALPIPDGSARSRTPISNRRKKESGTVNKRTPRRDREKSQRQRPKSSKEDSEPPPLMDPSKHRHSSPIPTKPYNELNKPQQSNRRSSRSTQSQEDSDDDYDSDSNGKQLFVLPRQLSLDQNSSQSNTSATDECESDEDEELEEEELTVSQSTPPPPTKTLGKSVSFNEEAIEYEGEDVIREWYSKEFLAQLIHHEVQIVSRAAASDSNNNSGNYKSLHCCWRGLEHIQRRLDKGQHIRDHVLGALQKQVLLWKHKQQQPMEEVLRHFCRTSSKEDRKRALVLGMEDAKFVARQNEFDRKCDQHDEELKKNGRMTMANYVSDSFRDASFSVSTAAMTKMVSDVVGGAATPKPVVTPLRETATTTTRQHPGSGSKLRGS